VGTSPRATGARGARRRRHTTTEDRENMTGTINGSKTISNALTVHFGDRINDNHW
jgi:hypothetical protein